VQVQEPKRATSWSQVIWRACRCSLDGDMAHHLYDLVADGSVETRRRRGITWRQLLEICFPGHLVLDGPPLFIALVIFVGLAGFVLSGFLGLGTPLILILLALVPLTGLVYLLGGGLRLGAAIGLIGGTLLALLVSVTSISHGSAATGLALGLGIMGAGTGLGAVVGILSGILQARRWLDRPVWRWRALWFWWAVPPHARELESALRQAYASGLQTARAWESPLTRLTKRKQRLGTVEPQGAMAPEPTRRNP
jgi:MFS family permease